MDEAIAAFDVVTGVAAIALATSRSRQRFEAARPIFCFIGVTVVAMMTFGLAAFGAPRWLLLLGGVCCAALFAAWFAPLFAGRRLDGHDSLGAPDSNGPGPQLALSAEPWWWDDFERQLRAYMRAHEAPLRPGLTLRRRPPARSVTRRRTGKWRNPLNLRAPNGNRLSADR